MATTNRPKPKTAGAKGERRPAFSLLPDALVSGPVAAISATIPSRLLQLVRSRVGTREFSQFVTRSMANELLRILRQEYIANVEAETGPIDRAEVEKWRKIFRS
jgi:hypothetical protein